MFEVPHFSLKYLFNSLHIDSISGIKAGISKNVRKFGVKFINLFIFRFFVRTDTNDELQLIVKVFI